METAESGELTGNQSKISIIHYQVRIKKAPKRTTQKHNLIYRRIELTLSHWQCVS